MKKKIQYQLEQFCDDNRDTDAFEYRMCMEATTIAEIETGFIAKIYGFEDNIDYYRQSSCTYFLEGIAVPTFILTAADDPFMDPSYFPIEKSVQGGGKAPLNMKRYEHGGHSGFLFHQPGPNDVVSTSGSPCRGPDDDRNNDGDRVSSFMPSELARFVDHVHSHPFSSSIDR